MSQSCNFVKVLHKESSRMSFRKGILYHLNIIDPENDSDNKMKNDLDW